MRVLIDRTALGFLPPSTNPANRTKPNSNNISEGGIRAAQADFRWIDPLDLESDIWIADEREPKWINNTWLMKFEGPTPSDGRWVQTENELGEGAWRWKPTTSFGESLIKEEGAWVFKGLEPRYQDGTWVFTSKHPELAFYFEGESYGAKIACDEMGVLRVAWDSETAKKVQIEAETSQIEKSTSLSNSQVPTEFTATETAFRTVDSLAIESDCWLMGTLSPRWINNRWLTHLRGPGPGTGNWVRFETLRSDEAWEWVPSDPTQDRFIREEGSWIFFGQKPKFESGDWIFYSTHSELSFYFQGENFGSKLSMDASGILLYAKDSESAIAKILDIEKSAEGVLETNTNRAHREEIFAAEVAEKELNSTPDLLSEPIVATASEYRPQAQAEVAAFVKLEPLGPVALAFLMSELVRSKGFSPQTIAQKFCFYLSSATKKRDVEVWVRNQSSWKLGATHSGFEPILREDLNELKRGQSISKKGAILVPIYSEFGDDTGESELLGALLIGAPVYGEEDIQANTNFAVTAGEMLRGTLLSLNQAA